MTNKIIVYAKEENKGVLEFPDYGIKTIAYLGKNGLTKNKKEGDKKTPIGEFELGVILGSHPIEEVSLEKTLEYKQITETMYWVDDPKSKYYNKLVDINKLSIDWKSAEHLIEYPIQYEYLVEIKTNPHNIKGLGSAVFLHCTNNKATGGCIAVDRNVMKELLTKINKETKIKII